MITYHLKAFNIVSSKFYALLRLQRDLLRKLSDTIHELYPEALCFEKWLIDFTRFSLPLGLVTLTAGEARETAEGYSSRVHTHPKYGRSRVTGNRG